MSDFKIIGNPTPRVGEKQTYSIAENFTMNVLPFGEIHNHSEVFSKDVHWSIYQLIGNKWVHKPKNDKVGSIVKFSFFEATLDYEGIRLIAKLGNQEAKMDIKTQKSVERKIAYVDFLDANWNKPTKPFAYTDKVIVRIHCVNLDKCRGSVTLWEDDTPKSAQNGINKNNKATTLPIFIEDGKAEAHFILTPSFAKMSNAQADKGGSNEGEFHEYYVTVEIFNQKPFESRDINVLNPDYKKSEPEKQTPAQKKGPSKKEEKGIAKTEDNLHDYYEKTVDVRAEIQKIGDSVRETLNKAMMIDDSEGSNPQTGTCVCKDYDLIWGNKVSCDFRKKVVEICKDLWAVNYLEMANNLMAVMAWETGETFSPSIKNPKSSATGLVQFMKDTAENLGTTTEKLAKMTALEQLDYVKKYFKNLKNKKLEFVDFYLQVLFPASMGKPDDHVVFSEDGKGLDKHDKNYDLRIRAYKVNEGFDTNPKYGNNDGMVTKGEIKKGIQIYIEKGKENKVEIFSCTSKDVTTKNNWHNPVNNPQLRGWYSIWAPERSIHSNNITGRSKGKHDGIDLYAPAGTDLYACVDGEVNEIYYSESYGNCINIKGNYEGKTFWFFYAHLSETLITAKDKEGNSTKVKAGDKIGKSGKTGSSATALNSNQVHLHFEVRTTNARTGGRVNPFDNIKELDRDVIKEPKKEAQP
ncbi:M23 family metallopeptidase [Flavobacterium daemonense]|uniref:M23 family metallopeptidase n=1 Tax=Flavobacterium daemonense TaxID=1393049 RepID=UPI00118574B2|nr:M23 family metallopeptidase [Flavobacterium daemonense]KAF2333764.1 M23 family metallopeptidase [Flavobacterium daemonense]